MTPPTPAETLRDYADHLRTWLDDERADARTIYDRLHLDSDDVGDLGYPRAYLEGDDETRTRWSLCEPGDAPSSYYANYELPDGSVGEIRVESSEDPARPGLTVRYDTEDGEVTLPPPLTAAGLNECLRAAENLEDLLDRIQRVHAACRAHEDETGEDAPVPDWSNLPTFGGRALDGGRGPVWSWDDERALVGSGDDLEIVRRDEAEYLREVA